MYATYNKAFQNITRHCPVFIFVNVNEIGSLKQYKSTGYWYIFFLSLFWASLLVSLSSACWILFLALTLKHFIHFLSMRMKVKVKISPVLIKKKTLLYTCLFYLSQTDT